MGALGMRRGDAVCPNLCPARLGVGVVPLGLEGVIEVPVERKERDSPLHAPLTIFTGRTVNRDWFCLRSTPSMAQNWTLRQVKLFPCAA